MCPKERRNGGEGTFPRSTFIHETGHNGAADPKVVNERSSSLVVGGTTGGLRGTPLSPRFLLFSDGLLPIFDAVEFHGGKRDTNCARLVKDQPPPSPSFKKRLRSYSTQAQGQQPFALHRFGHFFFFFFG